MVVSRAIWGWRNRCCWLMEEIHLATVWLQFSPPPRMTHTHNRSESCFASSCVNQLRPFFTGGPVVVDDDDRVRAANQTYFRCRKNSSSFNDSQPLRCVRMCVCVVGQRNRDLFSQLAAQFASFVYPFPLFALSKQTRMVKEGVEGVGLIHLTLKGHAI